MTTMFGCTTNGSSVVAVPNGVSTEMRPESAPEGTYAVIWSSPSTVNPAVRPAKRTSVVVDNPFPWSTTGAASGPRLGEKPSIVGPEAGGSSTVNDSALTAVSASAMSISIGPVVAPSGTVAVICSSVSTTNVGSFTPLKRTAVAPTKPTPVMTTDVPICP